MGLEQKGKAEIKLFNATGSLIKVYQLPNNKTGSITITETTITIGSYVVTHIANGSIIDSKILIKGN